MDAHIKQIRDKLWAARKDIDKYQKAMEAMQDICEHDWHYDGHGHNSDFYTCNKCGASKED